MSPTDTTAPRSAPHPAGPRALRRSAVRRRPRPAPLEPAGPSLRGADRPRREGYLPDPDQASHQASPYGVTILTSFEPVYPAGHERAGETKAHATVRHVYGGTVPRAVVQDRRARTRLAGRARTMHRKAAA